MIIQRVQGQYLTNFNNTLRTNPSSKKAPTNNDTRATYAKVPIGHTYGANILTLIEPFHILIMKNTWQ